MSRKSLLSAIRNSGEEINYAEKFNTEYNYSVEKRDKDNPRAPSRFISPSSVKCDRNIVFKLLGEPQQAYASSNLIHICDAGSDIHERVQDNVLKMCKAGIDCEYVSVAQYIREHGLSDRIEIKQESDFSKKMYETKLFVPELSISCLVDGIIKFHGKYYILEIKTESTNKFFKQKDIQEEHKYQATAYSLILGISEVMFFYVDRDLFNTKAYIYKPSKEEKDTLNSRLLKDIEYAKNKVIPPKTMADKRACTYCPYKSKCESISEGEVKYD